MIKMIGAVADNDWPQASADSGVGELAAFGDKLTPRRRAGMCAPANDPAAVFLRLPGDPGAQIALRQAATQPVPTERGSLSRRDLRHTGLVPGGGGLLGLDHIFHRRAGEVPDGLWHVVFGGRATAMHPSIVRRQVAADRRTAWSGGPPCQIGASAPARGMPPCPACACHLDPPTGASV